MMGRNFKSFQEPFDVPMDNLGLVLVNAINEVSKSADSNGAGKTSLIVDFPSWVLFGKTPSGAMGTAVACRFNEEQCLGSVVLEDAEGEWIVTRTARPSSLMVEGPDWTGEDQKALQLRIEQRLGWGLKTFKNAIIFGQGAFDRFAQADQAEQMKMLDEIQGIDLTKALKRAEAWRKELQQRVDSLDASIRSEEEAMGRLERMISEMEQSKRLFDGNKEQIVTDLQGQIYALGEEHARSLMKIETAQIAANRLDSLKTQWDLLEQARVLTLGTGKDVQSAIAMVDKEQQIVDSMEQQIAELLVQAQCPTCLGPINADAEQRVRQANAEALLKAKMALEVAQGKCAGVSELHKRAVRKFEKRNEAWPYQEPGPVVFRKLEATDGQGVVEGLKKAYLQMGAEISRLENHLNLEKEKVWDSEKILTATRDEQAAFVGSLRDQRIQLDRANRALTVANYWVVAFGDRGIRSLLVDSVAGYINERLAYHLSILAAGEVNVAVSATSELKSGKVKEDLSIKPVWAWGANLFGMGSHGQDRRVDLALFAALQDLAESRSAKPFPMKVWDEPGDALDSLGKEIFCRWVEDEARKRGTGFLVTHSPELSAQLQPDRIWTIVLGKGGARVEVS